MMLKQLSAIRLFFILAATIFIAACSEQTTGPVEVKWDRDSCERCRMMLSDRDYSAQIRVFPEGKRSKVFRFDDVGCATLWLDASEWKDNQQTEIWVRSFKEDKWIDAKTAWYIKGKVTPMGYGLGAQSEKQADAIDFIQAKKHIVEVEKKFNIHGGSYNH